MRLRLLLFLAHAVLLPSAYAQGTTLGRLTIEAGCAFEGESPRTVSIARPSPGAVETIRSIAAYSGLPARFEIFSADGLNNAVATVVEGHRVILYDPRLLHAVEARTRTYWAAVGILAHEIGHHLSGHTFVGGGSRPATELEADYFAGFILYKMGASLAEAQSAFDALGSHSASATHPSRTQRLRAVRLGWEQSAGQRHEAATPPPPEHDPHMPVLSPYNDTPVARALPDCPVSREPMTVVVYDAPSSFSGSEHQFTLQHSSGERYQYILETNRMSMHQLGWFPEVMKPGRRLSIEVAYCGAAGRFMYLTRVAPLPPR